MNEIVNEIIYDKPLPDGRLLTAVIEYDDNPQDPRYDYEPLGHMACIRHRSYDLGDEQLDHDALMEQHEEYKEKALAYLPLYLYDHGGITISTTPFSCRWDSGQIGWIYMMPEDAKGMTKEKAIEILQQEVKEYDRYLQGEVYTITIFAGDDVEDSLSNINDEMDYARRYAEEQLEHVYEYMCKAQNKEINEKEYWEARDVVTV